jgi:hypothetical protein
MRWKYQILAKSLNETERPLIVSVSLSMALASEAHWADRQFRRFNPTLKKL